MLRKEAAMLADAPVDGDGAVAVARAEPLGRIVQIAVERCPMRADGVAQQFVDAAALNAPRSFCTEAMILPAASVSTAIGSFPDACSRAMAAWSSARMTLIDTQSREYVVSGW